MEEIKKFVEKEEVITERYEISGRVLELLKDFARSKFLGTSKYNILKLIIDNGGEKTSVEEITNTFNMSTPLVAYHINGNLNNSGLIRNELIAAKEENGKMFYSVTDYGKFIFEFAKVEDNPRRYKKV